MQQCPMSQVTKAYLAQFYHILDEMITGMTNAELGESISLNFIHQMIPHHRAAIEMSRNILQYTTSPALEQIAENIITEQTKSIEAIIDSMTPFERENPDIINQSRRRRIASGSGTTIQDVNRLLKQFDDMRKMMKMATSKNPQKLMAQANQMRKQMKQRR